MKIIKRIFCFVAITVFLVSGVCGSFYESANLKVYATSTIPIGQMAYEIFSASHDGMVEIEDETHFFAKIEQKIIDTANSYIPMSALKTYLSLFYKTNKTALTKKGYTSAEDFINSMAFANTTAFLTWFRDSAYTEKLPLSLGLVKCMYNAVKVSFKEENAEIKEDENGNLVIPGNTGVNVGDYTEWNDFKTREGFFYYTQGKLSFYPYLEKWTYSIKNLVGNPLIVPIKDSSGNITYVFVSPNNFSLDIVAVGNSYQSESISTYTRTINPGFSYKNFYWYPYGVSNINGNSHVSNFKWYSAYIKTLDFNTLDAFQNYFIANTAEFGKDATRIIFPTYTDEQLQNLIDHVPGDGDVVDDDEEIVDPTVPDEPLVPEPTAPTSDFPGLFSWLKAIWQVLTTNVSYLKNLSTTASSFFTPITKTANNTTKMVDLLSTITKFANAWANPTSVSVIFADSIGDIFFSDRFQQKLITIFPDLSWCNSLKNIIETIPATVSLAMSDVLGLPADKATLWQNLTTYPKLIFDLLDGKWSVFPADLKTWIGGVTDAIRDLPISIGDVLADGLTLTFPDAINYSNPLAKIISLIATITDFLILDQSAVSTSAAGIAVTAHSKFGYMSGFGNLYDQFNFTNNYTYPIFKMGMPDILVPYLGKEIILIDFRDYATQFLAVRLFLRAMIWFSFVHHVAKLLTPRFRIS